MKIFYKTPTATSTGGRSGHVAQRLGGRRCDNYQVAAQVMLH